MSHPLRTVHRVAEMLRLNVESIYDLAGKGQTPSTKVSGRRRFAASETHDWLRAQSYPGTTAKDAIE